jgi:hypothetical protein
MSIFLPARAALLLAAGIVALPGAAQTAASAASKPPDPLNARAHVPALIYESALASFRRWSDDKPVSWREANDTVTRIGGWRVYAREAQQTEAVPPAAAADKAQPMPAGHGGHKAP